MKPGETATLGEAMLGTGLRLVEPIARKEGGVYAPEGKAKNIVDKCNVNST